MTTLYINPDTVQQGIITASIEIQAYFIREEGNFYLLEDLQKALVRWLEHSVEALVDDALFHTIEGDRSYTFNRQVFELQIKQLQPVTSSKFSQDKAAVSPVVYPENQHPESKTEEQPAEDQDDKIAVA